MQAVSATTTVPSAGGGTGDAAVRGRGPRRSRSLRVAGRSYPVLLPSIRDPRLHIASVLLSVQVLGQVSLGFELSIPQILASILTCAVTEVVVTFRRQRLVAWPASAMLTGNGIALIMRVNGTEHGDWWSTNGLWLFIGTALLAMATKYLIRVEGVHLFNPSNVALVTVFLAFGTSRVNPQDFWWGPPSVGLALTYVVILVGGTLVTRRLRLLGMAVAYWTVLAVGLGVVAASDQAMRARWNLEPVTGLDYWWVIVSSPEILIFVFFMITDPRTVPAGRVGRFVFGSLVGIVSVLLVAPQHTEFAAKVAVLASLTVVSFTRPFLDRLVPVPGAADDRLGPWLRRTLVGPPGRWRVPVTAASALALGAVVVALSGGPVPGLAQVPSEAAARPDVAVDAAELPPVRISPEVERINASVGPDDALQMAADLVANLRIQADAVRSGDVAMVEAATTAGRLEELRRSMRDGADVPLVDPADFTRFTVVVVRSDVQSIPTLGIEAEGAVEGPGGAVPFRVTYGLMRVGDHHLVSSESRAR